MQASLDSINTRGIDMDIEDLTKETPAMSKIMATTGVSSQLLYKWRKERSQLWHIIVLGVAIELAITGDDLLDDIGD